MKNNFKKTMISLLTTATMAVGMGGMSVSAASINRGEIRNEQNDILVWQETDSNSISLYAYNEWTSTGSKYVYGYDGSTIIGRQYLTSYRYENLDDLKKAKAVASNYKYNSSTKKYTYGWNNDADCYSRARVETVSGHVNDDSGRVFGKYSCTAETTELCLGVCKTYCGNLAAD